MSVASIGSVGASTEVTTNSLGQEEFLKILLTQLSFQDPLKPMDNQEFIAQMAQFSALEQTQQLNKQIDSLLTIQATTQALGLLNKTVEVSSSGGSAIGQVTTLSFSSGQPLLTVKTDQGAFLTNISLSQVSLVR